MNLISTKIRIAFFSTLFLISFSIYTAWGQVKLVSWNIQNFGKSKSDNEINFIANSLKNFDIITLQEVVAGDGGAQAVAKLADELNRKGSKWDYVVSNPTSGSKASERYAFIWKTARIKIIHKAWLDQNYQTEIDREPFLSTFEYQNKRFTIVSFHAIPKSKHPETEIKYLKFLPQHYPDLNLLFVGDFNCPQSHSVFNGLKTKRYEAMLNNQKTSLKQKIKNGECLASEYDNLFYSPKIKRLNAGVLHFYQSFASLKEARKISDHIPIWFEFDLN